MLRPAVALLAATAISVVGAACDGRPATERKALGRTYFDSTDTWVHAGVSARNDVDVEPLRRETLGADTASRLFDLYAMRCGSCHDAPDPGMKTGEHWSFFLPRMQDKTRTAGLMPMTDAEADSILVFLRRHGRSHAGSRRTGRP